MSRVQGPVHAISAGGAHLAMGCAAASQHAVARLPDGTGCAKWAWNSLVCSAPKKVHQAGALGGRCSAGAPQEKVAGDAGDGAGAQVAFHAPDAPLEGLGWDEVQAGEGLVAIALDAGEGIGELGEGLL